MSVQRWERVPHQKRSADWLAGAEAEARARTMGRSAHGLEVVRFVDVLAKNERLSASDIALRTARVFVARDGFMGRIRAAWEMLR